MRIILYIKLGGTAARLNILKCMAFLKIKKITRKLALGILWAIKTTFYPFHALPDVGNSALSLPISCMVCFGQLIPQIPHSMHCLLWAIKATFYPFHALPNVGNSAPSLPISCMVYFGQLRRIFTHFRQCTNRANHSLLRGIYHSCREDHAYLPHFMHCLMWAIQPLHYPFHAWYVLGN